MIRKHIPETNTLMEDMLLPEIVALESDMVVLSTDFQRAGRGQHDHRWESARGENLILGIIIHPTNYQAAEQKRLSDDIAEAVRLTVSHYLKQEGHEEAWMKQPNDIYVGKQKIAGLLIEHDLQGSKILTTRIGLGLNVNQRTFGSDAPNPCSLATLLNKEYDREEVLNLLLHHLKNTISI